MFVALVKKNTYAPLNGSSALAGEFSRRRQRRQRRLQAAA